jgi:hypothetical protein
VKFAVILPELTTVGIIVSRAPASANTKTVDVVMPLVLARLTVWTPGDETAWVLVVLTVETGQLVPLPVKVVGPVPPLLLMALMVPAVIVFPEVVSKR